MNDSKLNYKMRTQEDYIFSDVAPKIPEINLVELNQIQKKLEEYTSGKSKNGITAQEAKTFLDWVIFNARNYVVDKTNESVLTASMVGQCATTQEINYDILRKMGLDVKAFNTSNTLGTIHMREEEKERLSHLYGKNVGIRHAVSLVDIPIIDNCNETQLYKFQLDPTFRQFCLKENCNEDNFYDEEKEFVSPHPGYFMKQDNLIKLGVPVEKAKKAELLARNIITDGYFLLNEENAKLYGDAFVRASERLEFQNIPIKTSGLEYIRNFESNPSTVIETVGEEYKKLPSEIKSPKTSIFTKIKNYIKSKFQHKQHLALPKGSDNKVEDKKSENLQVAQLTEEQLRDFRENEKKILENYNDNYESQDNNKDYSEKSL